MIQLGADLIPGEKQVRRFDTQVVVAAGFLVVDLGQLSTFFSRLGQFGGVFGDDDGVARQVVEQGVHTIINQRRQALDPGEDALIFDALNDVAHGGARQFLLQGPCPESAYDFIQPGFLQGDFAGWQNHGFVEVVAAALGGWRKEADGLREVAEQLDAQGLVVKG